jgi:hypothetical protein
VLGLQTSKDSAPLRTEANWSHDMVDLTVDRSTDVALDEAFGSTRETAALVTMAMDALGLAEFEWHVDAALEAAELLEADPAAISMSAHLMALATKPVVTQKDG